MHQHTISSPQGTTASGQQLDQVEPHVPDEATTRSHDESTPSHSSMNPVLHSDLDLFLAPAPSSASDAASDMSRRSVSSKRTHFRVEHPPLSFLRSAWGSRQTWRIPATILGFYFISFFCAATHYGFFMYLDGRIISQGFTLSTKTTSVSQAYATTVSLVLVTAFRATLVASIGTCYTQHLWATFRKRVLKVSLIEDLFQVQTNPLHFLNHQLYLKTPILTAVAIFCWLVPIAILYPPGTLVVGIQPSSIDKSFNVSVFHGSLLDISEGNVIAQIMCQFKCIDYNCSLGRPPFQELSENVSSMRNCWSYRMIPDMGYITRSNLIVGEISRLEQVNKENTSYELSFIGTTLDCKTTNRSMESTILQLEHVTPADDSGKSWKIQHPEPVCVLTNNVDSGPWPGNTSITYRVAHYQDTLQYWPCLDKEQWIPAINGSGTMDTQYVDFPGAGIHVVVPITETVCYPKIVEYHVTISDALGAQHTSYVIKDDISMPVYTKYLENFDGNLTQFAQLSDALVIYRDFSMNLNQSGTGFVGNNFDGNLTQFAQLSDALVIHRDFSMNLNQSGTGFVGNNFEYPSMSNETKSYRNENGTVVETCMLKTVLTDETKITDSPQDIWPLGVFERRLHQRDMYYSCPAFDPDMANELLINTTISALSLNQRFDMVNGKETRGFNAYRFENKLAFFLPYGLSLTLAVPILALGFIALYVQNHGVSAISGGFLQLLMTTTGRTSPEAVVTKGSGTLGGYENVSNELREMEVRFGELIEVKGDDLKETDTLLSGHEGHADMQDVDRPQSDIETASGTERREQSASVVRRAGFGTVHEVGPFRKKGEL